MATDKETTELDYSKPLKVAKQENFCKIYSEIYNGNQSAIKAGYSEKSARSMASTLLTKSNIKGRIQYLQSQKLKNLFVTKDRVLNEYTRIGFANIQDFMKDGMTFEDFVKLPREVAAAIHSVEVEEFQGGKEGRAKSRKVKFKLLDKLQALESLSKYLGLYEADNKQRELSSIDIRFKGDEKPLDLNIED
jgi:phage terminase small subunit